MFIKEIFMTVKKKSVIISDNSLICKLKEIITEIFKWVNPNWNVLMIFNSQILIKINRKVFN